MTTKVSTWLSSSDIPEPSVSQAPLPRQPSSGYSAENETSDGPGFGRGRFALGRSGSTASALVARRVEQSGSTVPSEDGISPDSTSR